MKKSGQSKFVSMMFQNHFSPVTCLLTRYVSVPYQSNFAVWLESIILINKP